MPRSDAGWPIRSGRWRSWSREPWGQVAETHSAVVFFAGDRTYKVKKPVSLDFLDFSTLEARTAACARETELNLRFAPDVYLGVAEIRGPDGQVCDHLVVMRRMPAARRLSALVRSHAPVARPLRQVARILAVQHAKAARGPQIDQQGSRDALHRRWADNIGQTRQMQERLAPRGLPGPAVTGEIERLALRYLAGRADLVQLRCSASRELAARRMSARTSGVSDADPAIAAEMEAVADPWPDAARDRHRKRRHRCGTRRNCAKDGAPDPPPRPRASLAAHPAVHAPRVRPIPHLPDVIPRTGRPQARAGPADAGGRGLSSTPRVLPSLAAEVLPALPAPGRGTGRPAAAGPLPVTDRLREGCDGWSGRPLHRPPRPGPQAGILRGGGR